MLPNTDVIDAYESWWDGRSRQALVFYQHPQTALDLPRWRRPWLHQPADASWQATPEVFAAVRGDGDASRFEHLLDLAEAQADTLGFCGAGFPRYFPNLGPGIVASFVTGFSRYADGTVWFETPEPLALEAIPERADPARNGAHAALVSELITRAARRCAGRLQLSMTDLGGNLDLLAAMRGSDRMLLDLVEQPEEVLRCLEAIDVLWMHWFRTLDGIMAPASAGVRGCWMQLLSRRAFYALQCDAAAMISPRMFAHFVQPSLRRVAGALGRAVFHLDGVAAQRHLPLICDVPEIRAVQWTPGAGQPGVADPMWYPLYRRIIDAGRQVVLLGFPSEEAALRRLLAALPAGAFAIHCEGPDQAAGEALLRAAG